MKRIVWCLVLIKGIAEAFRWGVSTSAFQIEGAWDKEGKGVSVWDVFNHEPGRIADQSNADVAADHYHKWRQDIDMMKDLGVDAYRFSLAWTRILPNGKLSDINQKGIDFYNQILDYLVEKEIEPMITLWHWDTPQSLQEEYGGWQDDRIIHDFKNYARLCFRQFGDRVRYWITLNEPLTVVQMGYANGLHAPGIVEPSSLPYEVGHRMIKAHAAVYKMCHTEFHGCGQVSISLNSDFVLPEDDSVQNKEAAQRGIIWRMGWFADPILLGDYPMEMKERCGPRLPSFDVKDCVNGTLDFFALNHYTTLVGSNSPNNDLNVFQDAQVSYRFPVGGVPSASPWLQSYPAGIAGMLTWIEDRYNISKNNKSYVITESGISTYPNVLDDQIRIDYIREYSKAANETNLNISYYCVWSLLDNFEWSRGYLERFGLIDVDFNDPSRPRKLKKSAIWLKEYIHLN